MYGVSREKAQKLKGGGPVLGPGTGTSDSIKANVPAGSYIMPADSTAALGLNSKQSQPSQPAEAPRLGMGVPVNLSNGEHQFTPEQVSAIGLQALDQMKGATHAPTAEPEGKEMFFANGGLVEDPLLKRRLPGEPSAALTPAAQAPGNPGRAAQMQAQYDQPVTTPRSDVTPAKQASFDSTNTPQAKPIGAAQIARNVIDVPLGAAQQVAGQVVQGAGQGVDMVRRGTNSVFGGAPLAEPNKYGRYGAAVSAEGATRMNAQLDSANTALRAGTLSALGSTPAEGATQAAPEIAQVAVGVNPTALPPTAAGPSAAPALAKTPAAQEATPKPQGNGYGMIRADDQRGINPGIAMKVGADGVPLFTNDPQAVAGAGGDFVAPRAGVSRPGVGAISNMNNGVGSFSQNTAGDAELASGRFERANAIRAGIQRPRELGDNGGQLNIIKDSSRAPTLQERQLAKLDYMQAQTAEMQGRGARDERRLDIDSRRLDSQDARNQTNDSINNQKTQQDIEVGQFGVETARRLQALHAQYESAEPEDRAAIAEQIRTLTGKEQTPRFKVAQGGQEFDAAANALVNRPAMIFNEQTGEVLERPGSAGRATAAGNEPSPNHVNALKNNPAQAAQFDEIYGSGAAARILGGK